jgi:alpha-1,2-glucosyltransferase
MAVGLTTPGVHTAANRLLAAGLLCLGIAIASYGALHLALGPRHVFIHVRWAPSVDEATRQGAEQRYRLSHGELLNGRTWGYTLSDASRANVRALITDAVIEDTQDLDRTAFRVSPSAPRRPYPASDSRIPVALWGATVLCLFVGLTGISLGLIERAGAGAATARLAQRPVVEQRLTAKHGLSLLLVMTVMGVCFLVARTMDARVDEGNHLEQIDRYVAGKYVTNTGTIGGFHATAAVFKWLTGLPGKEGVRLFVLLISVATVLTFGSLVRSFEPQASTVRTLQFVFFPLLFPFWFLIYTDVYALMLLLLAILALRRDRFHVTGMLMFASVIVRQTYVVWLALLGVWTMLVNFAQPLRQIVMRCTSFGIAAALFLLFVIANGGVAVGDRDSHPDMELQTENLLYMLVCFFVMFLPLILSKLRQIVRLHPAILIGVPLSSVALFFGTFRLDHPWNIKWQDIFLRNAMLEVMTSSTVAGLVTSVAIALAVLSLFVIRLRQPIHYLVYPFAALSVMPVWLIEQRYYLPAFALFMLFRESASRSVERMILAMNAAMALYLFVGVVRGWFFL